MPKVLPLSAIVRISRPPSLCGEIGGYVHRRTVQSASCALMHPTLMRVVATSTFPAGGPEADLPRACVRWRALRSCAVGEEMDSHCSARSSSCCAATRSSSVAPSIRARAAGATRAQRRGLGDGWPGNFLRFPRADESSRVACGSSPQHTCSRPVKRNNEAALPRARPVPSRSTCSLLCVLLWSSSATRGRRPPLRSFRATLSLTWLHMLADRCRSVLARALRARTAPRSSTAPTRGRRCRPRACTQRWSRAATSAFTTSTPRRTKLRARCTSSSRWC